MQSKYFQAVVCVAGALFACCGRPATAWDHGGHMIVAHIAQNRLQPKVRARVEGLVPLIPDFRVARAGKKPQPYTFATAACWMDDVRGSKKREALSTWHYIDVPCGGDVD